MSEIDKPARNFLETEALTFFSRRGFLKTSATVATSMLYGCQAGTEAGIKRRTSQVELAPPTGVEDEAWAEIRAQFLLDPGIAYMNNASLGMPPSQIVASVHAGYEAISREPLHGKHDLQTAITEKVLPGLGTLFGVTSEEISLTRNATEALHLQSVGLDLAPGDEVLVTTQEHPAGIRPWMLREAREGIRVSEVFIPSPFQTDVEVVGLMEAAITDRTKAISFCHVTRGGHLYPVKKLAFMAHERGLACLVDGAQAVGQFPIDLIDLGCDAYSASLHKWLLGPAGTGFLYVREGARNRIKTAFAPDATPDAPAFDPPGTADFPLRAALMTMLDFVNAIGLERIEERCRYLSNHLKSQLSELAPVTILSGPLETSCPGSTIFEFSGLDAIAAVPMMEQQGRVHIDEHQRDGHNAIRVSTHFYNTRLEIDRLVDALRSVA